MGPGSYHKSTHRSLDFARRLSQKRARRCPSARTILVSVCGLGSLSASLILPISFLILTFPMSQTQSASTSSSNFQSLFNTAIKAYEKKTKKDLLAHPLAAQLQACKSPGDISVILQDKVNEFDQSRSADERLSRWLNPTINVLYAFSATLGGGVGLVGPIHSTYLHSSTSIL